MIYIHVMSVEAHKKTGKPWELLPVMLLMDETLFLNSLFQEIFFDMLKH